MKITKHILWTDKPNPCGACKDEWNGCHITSINIAKGFTLNVIFCHKCYLKLKRMIE